ncbi:MAG: hypothetical protein HY282_15925 [Nitrospirae bacterium]|nr:hypothetical protein [Candidatus Manganitrophaceae bacterium]
MTREMKEEAPDGRGASIASKKADQLAQVGRLRYQIFLFEQKGEKTFSEIGERLFQIAQADGTEDPTADPLIKKKLAEAKKIERKLRSLHNKMAQLREKAA